MHSSEWSPADPQRLIRILPPELAKSFSHSQLQALHEALAADYQSRHAVNIRVSIPLLRWYIVFLAGQERRSPTRLAQERLRYRLWTPSNILTLMLFAGILASNIAGVGYWLWNKGNARRASYPTVLPWVSTAADCRGEGQEWREGQCWDQQHNRDF